MSAIRRTNQRAATRSHGSLPYARPQPGKSSWSLTSWLNYLNPLRIKSPNDDYPEETDEDGPSLYGSEQEQDRSPSPELAHAAQTLSERGTQMGVDLSSIPPRQRMPLSSHAMPPSGPPPPPTKSLPVSSTTSLFSIPESSSPATNLRTVSSYLNEKAGQPLSPVEVAGLVSLIQRSTPAEKEPFRFTTSSAALPSRNDSATGNGNIFAPSGVSQASTAPKKMLTRNPNGVYRWQGAGSAKVGPSRNRYSSPAFGPTRSSERLIIKDMMPTEPQRADNKRRRVGETSAPTSSPSGNLFNGASNDSLSVRSSAPEPSPGRVNLANSVPLAQPIPTTPTRTSSGSTLRPRVTVPPKPTTPAIPSPLRQAWTGNSPQSDKSDTSPPPVRPTKAANLMTELIKEAAPLNKPDVSNPYQTANPYGKVPTKPKPKRPRPVRQPPVAKEAEKDSGREEEQDQEKKGEAEAAQQKKDASVEKEYSPQAIIEATVPKGSKRSRPPAHLTKSDTPPAGTESKEPYVAMEVEEEENRSAKKTKISPDVFRIPASTSTPTPTPKPIPAPTAPSKPPSEDITTTQVPKLGSKSKSEPVPAPEPKGFSFNPEPKSDSTSNPEPAPAPEPKGFSFGLPPANGSAAPHTSSGGLTNPTKVANRPVLPSFKAPTAPKEPSKLRYVFQPEPSSSGATTPEPTEPTEPTPAIPAIPPVPPVTVQAAPPDPKAAALALPRSSLPAFAFTLPTVVVPSASSHVLAQKQVKALAETSVPSFEFSFENMAKDNASAPFSGRSNSASAPAPTTGFNWAAAGMKPAPAPSGGSWTCSACMLSNPATATERCTVCDALKPSGKPEAKSNGGFNWNAVEMKPPSAHTGGNWTCSVCMLSNPTTATERCTVCDAPKPVSKPAATSNGGFNWAAAGIKPPSAPTESNWTCSTCMLSNPATAKDRCTVCDAPR